MRDTIRVVFLVGGDGRLGQLDSCWSNEGVNSVHLLFGDAALSEGFVGVGAPKDSEVALSLKELGVFRLGVSQWVTIL